MIVILLTLISIVNAQVGAYSALAVLRPSHGEVVNAGDTFEFKWVPSAAIPSVDLVLKSGTQGDLITTSVVARNLANTGSYVWSVPRTIKTSTALTLMVHDSRDPQIANYSPYFTILEVGRGITKAVSFTNTASAAEEHQHRPTETIFINIREHHSKSLMSAPPTVASRESSGTVSTEEGTKASSDSAAKSQAALPERSQGSTATGQFTDALITKGPRSQKLEMKLASSASSVVFPSFLLLILVLLL